MPKISRSGSDRRERDQGPPRGRPERRQRRERRQVSVQSPREPTTWGHILDFLFWRAFGVGLIANEVLPRSPADWHVIAAGFGMFFMPDALRGRNSLPVQILRRWLEERA